MKDAWCSLGMYLMVIVVMLGINLPVAALLNYAWANSVVTGFGAPPLDYWQCYWLMVVTGLLIKSAAPQHHSH